MHRTIMCRGNSVFLIQRANIGNSECPSTWKDAIGGYLNARMHQSVRRYAGSLPYFAHLPKKHFHEEGMSLFLLHHHLLDAHSEKPGTDCTKWEAAISLVAFRMESAEADSGLQCSCHNFIPAAYLLFRLFGYLSAVLRKVFDSSKSDSEIRNDFAVKKMPQWPVVAPISSHVIYRLFHIICTGLDGNAQTVLRVPHYEFLSPEFYDALCDSPRRPSETQFLHIDKQRLLCMLHEWVLSPGIISRESSAICNVLLMSFSVRAFHSIWSGPISQINRQRLWWTRVPLVLPLFFRQAQGSDPSIRLMSYLACSVYLRFDGGYEKLYAPTNVRNHVPIAVSPFIERSDTYHSPKIIQPDAKTSNATDRISLNLPSQMKTLLNVFSRTLKKYTAFHSHFAGACSNSPEKLDWYPLRSISVQIFRILLLFYQTELSREKQASFNNSSLKGTWRLAAIFLSHLSAANKSWDVAENPLVCSSMYFALVALMHSNANDKANAIIKHHSAVQHMNAVIFKQRVEQAKDGHMVYRSVIADVYTHVRNSFENTCTDAVTRAKDITMIFTHLVLRTFQYRSIGVWAKSIYAFSNQQSVFEHLELKRAISSTGGYQPSRNQSPGSMSLYALGSKILSDIDVTRVVMADLFRQLCVQHLTMNSHSRTNQAPFDYFWTQTTFKRLVGYIQKVYLCGLCPTSVLQDNSQIPMSRMGVPGSTDFQGTFLRHKPRFCSFPFPPEDEQDGSWVNAIRALHKLNYLTVHQNQTRQSFENSVTYLFVLLCAGRVDLAGKGVQNILESLGRPLTFNNKIISSKQKITLMDFGRSSTRNLPRSIREALPSTVPIKAYHILDPLIIYCAITNNYVFIIQELLFALRGLCRDAPMESGIDEMCYIASEQFWNAGNLQKSHTHGPLLLLMKMLLCTLRSLPKGKHISRFSGSSAQSPEGAKFSKSYLLRFADSVVRYMTSCSGIEVYSMDSLRTHLKKVIEKFPCRRVSREVYMKMNSVDFQHSFLLIDTVNMLRPVDLKVFLEALSQSMNTRRSITVLIPCTFLIEHFFVAQHSLKKFLKETSRSIEELFSFVLRALTDLTTIPNVSLLVMSPEAEYELRIPMEAVHLHPELKSEISGNFLYRLETDHVLSAVGAGLHRLLEELTATSENSAYQNSIDQRRFTDSWEILVVSDDKLSASIASYNELRCTGIHLHAKVSEENDSHELAHGKP